MAAGRAKNNKEKCSVTDWKKQLKINVSKKILLWKGASFGENSIKVKSRGSEEKIPGKLRVTLRRKQGTRDHKNPGGDSFGPRRESL